MIYIYIYIYIVTLYAFIYENVKNINETTRHLKFRYISILTNLYKIQLLIVVMTRCEK